MQTVKENSDLIRDPVSGAIINVNKTAYANAMRTSQLIRERNDKQSSMETDINNMKEMITDMQIMLSEFKRNQT